MTYPQSQAHTRRQNGPPRDVQVRNSTESHPASHFTNASSAHHGPTAYSLYRSDQRRSEANGYPQNHAYYHNNLELDLNLETHSWSSDHLYDNQENDHYEDVPRSWRSHNPEVSRIIHAPVLQQAIVKLGGRNDRATSHGRSMARQPGPTPNRHHTPPSQTADWHLRNSRPLGMSNLRDLNQARTPIPAMDRQMREGQRSGPFDALASVGRQSGNEGHGEYEYGHDEEEYEYSEEFDGRNRAYY